MHRHKTVVMTAVQLENSEEVGVSVTLKIPCDMHDGHTITDDWRVPASELDGSDFDWMKDILVSVIERY